MSHHPQADPGTSTATDIRLAYASIFKKLQRTPAEIMANYKTRNVSQSTSRKALSVVDDAATSTSIEEKPEIQERRESIDVEIGSENVQDSPKPKPTKSRLSESWTPADTEEVPSPPNKQSSVSDSDKVADAAIPPQPLTKLLTPVSRTIYSPRRWGPKQSSANAKQVSSCPVCLSLPFHLRFKCPVIASGADAITERIAQLKAEGGKEGLIEELEEWLQKDRKRKGSKEVSHKETETHNKVSPSAAGQSRHQGSPLPPWAPILSLQTRPSEVIVESTHEGSESTTSSSSEQEDNSSSSTESSSSLGSGSMSHGVNLERVDLDSLIRGPSPKAAPAELLKDDDGNGSDDEEAKENPEDDDVEGDIGSFEEEEEEEEEEKPLPKRLRGLNPLRSESPEAVSGDEDEDSTSDVEQGAATGMAGLHSSTHPGHAVETEPSVGDVVDGKEVEQDHRTTGTDNDNVELLSNASHLEPGDLHATPASFTV